LSYPYLEACVKVTYWSLSNVSWLITGPISVLKDGLNYLKGDEKGLQIEGDTTLFTISKDSIKEKVDYFKDIASTPFKWIDDKLIKLRLVGKVFKWIIMLSLFCLLFGVGIVLVKYFYRLISWPITLIWSLLRDIFY
jgi:hypothetical protein